EWEGGGGADGGGVQARGVAQTGGGKGFFRPPGGGGGRRPKWGPSDSPPPPPGEQTPRRNGCSPAMDRNPRAIGTPAAAKRPQNPSNSVSVATSLVPASMSQACRGMRLGINNKSGMR